MRREILSTQGVSSAASDVYKRQSPVTEPVLLVPVIVKLSLPVIVTV